MLNSFSSNFNVNLIFFMYKEALLHCAELKLLPYTVHLVAIHGFRELIDQLMECFV